MTDASSGANTNNAASTSNAEVQIQIPAGQFAWLITLRLSNLCSFWIQTCLRFGSSSVRIYGANEGYLIEE
jgi:hypothetical protein